MFVIRMGVPETKDLWDSLIVREKDGKLSGQEAILYRKWCKALRFLSANPRHPGLASHEIFLCHAVFLTQLFYGQPDAKLG